MKWSLVMLIADYFLILVGKIVRSTGTGSGCPDGATSFGNHLSQTDVSELPCNYKEQYSNYRHHANILLIKYLNIFGMSRKADHSVLIDNVYKYLILLILLEMIRGVMFAYFSITPFVQAIHLLFSTIVFGVLFYLYLVVANTKIKMAVSR